MKIFLDTAKIEEIEAVKDSIEGVTTNPSLIEKMLKGKKGKKVNLEDYIKKILKMVKGPVSLQVKSLKADQMVKEAIDLYKKYNPVRNNVIIKIPVSTYTGESNSKYFEGLKAIQKINKATEDCLGLTSVPMMIPINTTLVMTVSQAMMAARAGAAYVSPFVGRIDDYLQKKGLDSDEGISSGIDLVKKIVQVYKNYGFNTQVIAASIRNRRHVEECALVGADIATIPFSILKDMDTHPQTREGIKKFREDSKKY